MDLSRRDFIHAGTLSLAALQTGLTPQQQDGQQTNTEEFQTVAHLIGPEDARPEPGSDFFQGDNYQKVYYAYLYDSIDTGNQYFITQDDADWQEYRMIPKSQLDEVVTSESDSFFNHTFARPEAPDDKNWQYTDADVTKFNSEIELASTTTLETNQRGNYPPGSTATPGVALRFTGTPTGGEALGGYFNDNNGLIVGEDTTDSFVRLRAGGTDVTVYRTDWNGYVPDERVWVSNRPVITRFPHLFYGGGDLEVRALLHGADSSELRTLHTFTPDNVTGIADGPPIQQPNLPVRFQSIGLTGGNLRANACHYEFSQTHSETRINGEHFQDVSVSTTGWTPLLLWRKRPGWEMVNVKPLKIAASAATNDAKLEILLDSEVSNVTTSLPTHTTSDETAVEIVDATVDTLGERRWVGYSAAGQGNSGGQTNPSDLTFNLPSNETIGLFAQAVGGTATVSGAVAWEEYF